MGIGDKIKEYFSSDNFKKEVERQEENYDSQPEEKIKSYLKSDKFKNEVEKQKEDYRPKVETFETDETKAKTTRETPQKQSWFRKKDD